MSIIINVNRVVRGRSVRFEVAPDFGAHRTVMHGFVDMLHISLNSDILSLLVLMKTEDVVVILTL